MIAPDARELVYPGMIGPFIKAHSITDRNTSARRTGGIVRSWIRFVLELDFSAGLYGIRGLTARFWKNRFSQTLLLAVLFSPVAASAQAYEGSACQEGNSEIRALLKDGQRSGMTLHLGITGDAQNWSTSFLKAEGKPPARMPDYDVELDGDMDIHDWTCMFAAFRAFDKNQETAWAEGVKGPGIGEVLIVKLEDSAKPIKIRPGFALSDALFQANNRPERIRVYAISPSRSDATQMGLLYSDWKVLTKKEFKLQDRNAWQTIQLPAHKVSETRGGFIAIEILSVYKGSKYDDTLISEVMN